MVAQDVDGIGYEVIVVDDGSTDRTAEVAKATMDEAHVPGRVVSLSSNSGVSHARNVGWREAEGAWLQFLDSDDLLGPAKLRVQSQLALSSLEDVAVIYSPWRRLTGTGGAWSPTGPVVASFVDDSPLVAMLGDGGFGYLGPSLIRRAALEQVGGFDEEMRLGEDFDLMLRLAMAGCRFRGTDPDEAMFYYRDTPGSLWQRAQRHPGALTAHLASIHRAELFLRARAPGKLSLEARVNLARRYMSLLPMVNEEPARQDLVRWLTALRIRSIPFPGRRPLRVVARLAGVGSAIRLQDAYGRLRRAAKAVSRN